MLSKLKILKLHVNYLVTSKINLQLRTSKEKMIKDLAILVGGAGFTGIEFLGELTERIPELCNKYGVNQNKVRVTCVEGAKNVTNVL